MPPPIGKSSPAVTRTWQLAQPRAKTKIVEELARVSKNTRLDNGRWNSGFSQTIGLRVGSLGDVEAALRLNQKTAAALAQGRPASKLPKLPKSPIAPATKAVSASTVGKTSSTGTTPKQVWNSSVKIPRRPAPFLNYGKVDPSQRTKSKVVAPKAPPVSTPPKQASAPAPVDEVVSRDPNGDRQKWTHTYHSAVNRATYLPVEGKAQSPRKAKPYVSPSAARLARASVAEKRVAPPRAQATAAAPKALSENIPKPSLNNAPGSAVKRPARFLVEGKVKEQPIKRPVLAMPTDLMVLMAKPKENRSVTSELIEVPMQSQNTEIVKPESKPASRLKPVLASIKEESAEESAATSVMTIQETPGKTAFAPVEIDQPKFEANKAPITPEDKQKMRQDFLKNSDQSDSDSDSLDEFESLEGSIVSAMRAFDSSVEGEDRKKSDGESSSEEGSVDSQTRRTWARASPLLVKVSDTNAGSVKKHYPVHHRANTTRPPTNPKAHAWTEQDADKLTKTDFPVRRRLSELLLKSPLGVRTRPVDGRNEKPLTIESFVTAPAPLWKDVTTESRTEKSRVATHQWSDMSSVTLPKRVSGDLSDGARGSITSSELSLPHSADAENKSPVQSTVSPVIETPSTAQARPASAPQYSGKKSDAASKGSARELHPVGLSGAEVLAQKKMKDDAVRSGVDRKTRSVKDLIAFWEERIDLETQKVENSRRK